MNKYFMMVCLIVVCFGCSSAATRERVSVESPPYENKNRIIEPALLAQGGRIAISEFIAGPGVEATDELDKTGLMVIKGIIEKVNEGGRESAISIATGLEATRAEFLMKGRIVKKGVAKKMGLWIFGDKPRVYAVQGKVVDKKTGQPLMYFKMEETAQTPEDDFAALAQKVGSRIGEFILSALEEEDAS